MKNRILLLALCAALAAGLCGCAAADPPPIASSEEESVVSHAEKPPRLVIWSGWNEDDPQAAVLREGVDDFRKTSPNAAGLTVEFNWAGDALDNMLAPAIEDGMQVDIFDSTAAQAYGAWRKFMVPLDEYYQRNWPSTGGKPYKDAVFPALQQLSRDLAGDGMIYTVGYQPYVFSFVYNKADFDKAGLTEPPKTWQEFTAACAALKANELVPLTADDSTAAAWFGLHLARLKGPDFVEELVNDSTGMVWDDEAIEDAAGYLEKIAKDGYFSDKAADNIYPAAVQEFAAGEVSMLLCGSWMAEDIRKSSDADFSMGYFNYPALDSGVNGVAAGDYGARAMSINKDCQTPDLAFELIAFLTTGKWDAEMSSRTGGIPADEANPVPEYLADAKTLFESLHTPFPPFGGVTANPDRTALLQENMQKLLAGTITAEQFIADCR